MMWFVTDSITEIQSRKLTWRCGNEMDGACGMYGKRKIMQGYSGLNLRETRNRRWEENIKMFFFFFNRMEGRELAKSSSE